MEVLFLKIAIKRKRLETAKRTELVAVADDAFRLLVVEIRMANDLFERGGVDFYFGECGVLVHFYPFLQISWQSFDFVQLVRADKTAHPLAVFADTFGVVRANTWNFLESRSVGGVYINDCARRVLLLFGEVMEGAVGLVSACG